MRLRVEKDATFNRTLKALLGSGAALRKREQQAAFAFGNRTVNTIRTKYRGAGKTTDTATAIRTRRLQSSYTSEVGTSGDKTAVDVGLIKPGLDAEVVRYARTHEYGATITGRPWLTIPLDAAKTARGVARGNARSFHNTFFRQSARGGLTLFQKRGKIKARPALDPASREHLPQFETDLADAAVKAVAS